jgi:hypothetical protein
MCSDPKKLRMVYPEYQPYVTPDKKLIVKLERDGDSDLFGRRRRKSTSLLNLQEKKKLLNRIMTER